MPPTLENHDMRIAALEHWREVSERLQNERHAANQGQLTDIKSQLLDTRSHLNRQDEKLDKVVEGNNAILVKLANQDGVAMATQSINDKRWDARKFAVNTWVVVGTALMAFSGSMAYFAWQVFKK